MQTVLQTGGIEQSVTRFLFITGLTFARLISFVQSAAFLGGSSVSGRVKVAVAVSLMFLVLPMTLAGLHDSTIASFGVAGFIGLLLKEFFVGYLLGLVSSLIFEAVQVGGRIIDTQRGSSMIQLRSPQLQEQVSEMGQFQFQLALVIFLMLGAGDLFIAALINSYEIIPLTGFPAVEGGLTPLLELLIRLTGEIVKIGFQLAAPVVVTLLLVDLLFGVVNRVASQINVYFLSMPVKMRLGLFVVLLYTRNWVSLLDKFFVDSLENFYFVLKMMR